MALKVGITDYSFDRSLRSGRMNVEGFIDFCGKAGFDGVDLMVYYWKDKDAEMAGVPGWLRRNKLRLVGYGVGNDLLTRDETELAKAMDMVRSGIDDAHRLGARMMRVFGGYSLEGWTTGAALHRVVECFRELVTLAERKNVVLTIENHGGFPGTAEEVIACIEGVGSPFFASLLDTANFLGAGQDPLEAARELAPYVRHVHVKDMLKFPAGSDRGHKAARGDYNLESCTVGKGIVPNRDIFRVLREAGYRGYVSLEAEGPADEDEARSVLAGLAYIREHSSGGTRG
jgi:sugar phosphate isomerase/epimerase